MARPIKRLHGEPDVVKDLRRRSRSTTIGVRDRERAEIILLRLNGVGVEAVAERLKTTAKRVSLWSGRFETLGLKGLDDKPGRGRKPSAASPRSTNWWLISRRILPSATPIQSPTSGRPRAPKSSPKSSAPAPPSTKPGPHELYDGN